MIQEIITRIKLTATEGKTLTNGETFGTVVFLNKNDSAENWHEITDAEAQALQEQGGESDG